jgi:hypothetical protein
MKVAKACLTAVRCMNEPVTTFYGGAARSVVMRREWRRRSNAVRFGFFHFVPCGVWSIWKPPDDVEWYRC